MEVPIQVVVRMRPQPDDDEEESLIEASSMTSQIILGSDNIFNFDAVFGGECSQKELFTTCIANNILPKFFQGINSTVLTYGQYASGKTYTMVGPEMLWAMNEEEFGILPQSIRHIFYMMNEAPNREYHIHVNYFMVQNEAIYDLLSSQPISSLNVLEDATGNVVVPGLTVIDCTDITEVLNCLKAGLLQRHSISTQGFNRIHAHTIFTLTLEHQWIEADGILKYICSNISFVDLAGSDGVKSLNGIMKEIIPNADLSILKNIIQSESVGACNILYKDSQLTHVLKDAFGGNSLTLMICCLSPLSIDYESTYDTLKICSTARSIMNRAVQNFIIHNRGQTTSIMSSNNNQTKNEHSSSQQNLQNNVYFNKDLRQPHFYGSSYNTACKENFAQRNSIPDVAIDSDEVFRCQFAASQWHQLVSSAENLLADILHADGVSPTDQSKIQSWLCMKAEADDCIGKDISALPHHPNIFRQLDVIEELSEPSDGNEPSTASCSSESDISSNTSLEDEFYDRLQTIENKFNVKLCNLIEKRQIENDNLDRLKEIASERRNLKLNDFNEVGNMSTDADYVDATNKHVPVFNDSINCNANWTEKDPVEGNDVNLDEIDAHNLSLKCGSKDNLLSCDSTKFIVHSQESQQLTLDRNSLKKVTQPVDSFEDQDFNDSSENELIRKVSSKLISLSKGPSKCVDNLKFKSTLLKKSIKSHIFRKKQKVMKHPEIILLTNIFDKGDHCQKFGFSLKVTQDRLKEVNAIIYLKEKFLIDLKQNRSENAIKKCQQINSVLEAELENLSESYYISQRKLMEVNSEADRMTCRKHVDTLKKDIDNLKKKIHRMKKVIAIAQNSHTKIAELEESVRELRTQQEELQTEIREEVQRKEQLEQIFDSRGARNPLCVSELLHDESPDGKRMISSRSPLTSSQVEDVPSSQTKKRKYTNSPAFLKNSHTLEDEIEIRAQIGSLRDSKLMLVHKRQKLDKKLRKNRYNDADEERKLLEIDEAIEGLDMVIERLNLYITGGAPILEDCTTLLQRYDLIANLKELSSVELMHLLVKYFNRVIDLRIEFRKQEIDYRNLETQYDQQSKYVCGLMEAYRQASLEMEHQHTSMQWNYEEKISMLLRQLNDDSSGRGGDGKMRIWEKELFYYKELSRQLKENLKKYTNSSQTRPIDRIPDPSKIRNQRQSYASADPHEIRRERRFAIQDGGISSQTKITRKNNKLIIQRSDGKPKSPLGER